jgi:hypothetical protein
MRNARKHLVWVLGLTLALGVSGVAEAVSTQHLEASIDKKLSSKKKKKKKYKNVDLTVHTFTEGTADVGPLPDFPSQTQTAILHFGKGFKFTTKGLPQCNQNDPAFQSGTSEAAIAACGPNGTAVTPAGEDSTVGSGAARALTPLPPPNDNVPVEVNAFNGTPGGGNPTILLHSRADQLDNTTPLVGELDGRDLIVPVPQLAAGFAVLSDFETTVGRKYKPTKSKKKKKKFYVGARCKNNNAGLNITSDWTYYDGATPANDVQNETPIEPCKK